MNKTTKIIAVVVTLGVVGGAYWYLAPRFMNKAGWKDSDTTNMNEQINNEALMGEFKDAFDGSEDVTITDAMPEGVATVIAQGTITDVGNKGSGTVRVLDMGNGKRIIRLENLNISKGPKLNLLLSQSTYIKNSTDLGSYIDLGSLKGNKGNQNYELTPEIEIERYNSVVIYSSSFSVVFNMARLERAE